MKGGFSMFPILTAAAEPTMSSLLGDLETVATKVWTQVGTVGTTIMGNPLLLFTVGFLFVGGCVGIFSRLIHR